MGRRNRPSWIKRRESILHRAGARLTSRIAEAAKAAKKAEAQAKFEALRSEQMAKMALAKAEVQRREEIAKFAPTPEPKVAPKGKLGKFSSKFSSAVLFPEGGKNSTMF